MPVTQENQGKPVPQESNTSQGPHTNPSHHGHSHSHHRSRRVSEMSEGPGLLEFVAMDEPEDHEVDQLTAHSSSIIKFYPDWCSCFECNNKNKRSGPIQDNATFWEHIQDFFDCPPRGTFGRIMVFSMLFVCLWGMFYYLLSPLAENGIHHHNLEHNPAYICGPLFALGVVEISGLMCGIFLKKFLNLPPLLGPLILGIVESNVPSLNVFHLMKSPQYKECHGLAQCEELAKHTINCWVKPIRIIALAIILTRAGLELSPKQLRKLKGIVPLLAFGPCVVEACVCATVSYLFFNVLEPDVDRRMGIAMCFVGGFALAAVSPAVVVPGALSLKKAGYGVVKGVPTLMIAASSIDDVLAISIYTIALGFAVSDQHNEAWKTYSGGLIGITVGIFHGVFAGVLLHFVPSQFSRNKAETRVMLLLPLNIVAVLAYEETFYNGAGSVSVLVTSFIAGFGWRSQPHWKYPMHKIEKILAHLWVLWVPLIFGTIGKEIDFNSEGFQGITLVKTFGVIGISLVFRCLAAFLCTSCTGFTFKERIFVALAWIPKATVQAALAPLVLTRASDVGDSFTERNATLVVNMAILAVLITAPLGSVLIAFTGPKLLQKNTSPEIKMEVEMEFPNGEGFDQFDPPPTVNEEIIEELMKNKKSLEPKFRRGSGETIESGNDDLNMLAS